MSRKLTKSFVGHPGAILLANFGDGVFNNHSIERSHRAEVPSTKSKGSQ